MSAIKQFVHNEWRQVIRDPLLRWLILMPVAIAFAFRFVIPALNEWLQQSWQFDLTVYYPLLLGMLPQLTPSIIGMLVGFLLLDQKDDKSLAAIMVTPMGLNGYLRYKMLTPVLLSIPLNIICLSITDLLPMSFAQILLASVSPVLLAPFLALSLSLLADNKVQGFALAKTLNAVLFPPIIAWFFPATWNWLLGFFPTWWPMKAFWLSFDHMGYATLVVFIGLIWQCLVILWLWTLFSKRQNS